MLFVLTSTYITRAAHLAPTDQQSHPGLIVYETLICIAFVLNPLLVEVFAGAPCRTYLLQYPPDLKHCSLFGLVLVHSISSLGSMPQRSDYAS